MVVLMFILLPISVTIEYIQRFKSFSAGEFPTFIGNRG